MNFYDLNSNSGIERVSSIVISDKFSEISLLNISRSNYCNIYKAKRFGKWHILKCLKNEFASDNLYQNLIQKEFEISYLLNHSNIVQSYGFEEIEGLGMCIIMEYVDGCTLDEYFVNHKPGNLETVRIISEICDALEYLHSKQIIHRDLKPSNVLLTYNGNNVKLIDFGLSDSDGYAILKQPAGSIPYASPEQREAGTIIDNRADIYALGVLLDSINKLRKINLPGSKKTISKCISQNRDDRFSSTKEVVKKLRQKRTPEIILVVFILIVFLSLSSYIGYVTGYDSGTGKEKETIYLFDDISKNLIIQTKQQCEDIIRSLDTIKDYRSYHMAGNKEYRKLLRDKNTYIERFLQKSIPPESHVYNLYKASLSTIVEGIYYDFYYNGISINYNEKRQESESK